mgnify:CR=1 FL=1
MMAHLNSDVTNIPNVKRGDEVLLFGRNLPVEELAKIIGTINYELVCGEIVRITRSPLTTSFIRLKEESFYEKLRQKMNDN